MTDQIDIKSAAGPPPTDHRVLLRGLVGALVGGHLGFLLFWFLAKQGLYSSMVPGILLGMVAGFAARGRSQVLGVICLVAAIPLTIFAEWFVFPFVKDDSFVFFLSNLHQLKPIKLIMMALGIAGAYWFGQGR
jgi:hypothetical protein